MSHEAFNATEMFQAFINNANKQSYQQSKLSTARICISVKLFKYNLVDEEAIFPLQSSIFCLTGGRDYGLLGS